MSTLAEIGIVFLLILLNGFFAMSELAIVSARRTRLKQMAEDGNRGAMRALKLAEDPTSFLSIVQTGMTVNSVLAAIFSGATLAGRFSDYFNAISWIAPHGEAVAIVATTFGVTYLSLVVGELMPKRIGLSYAEPIAVHVAFIMEIFAKLSAPVVWILRQSTEVSLHALGLANPRNAPVTEEEVKHLIAEGAETGAIKPAEKAMLDRVMRLADRTVRTIMTPRLDMVWLDADAPAHEHKKNIRASGYSRFPIARGDLEEILGVVHAKDILNAHFDGHVLALKNVMRPALIVPDTTPVLRLLDQFKQSGQHIAMVVDEYGSVEGLVSVTDILVAITGELPERGQDNSDKPVQREDGSWLIDGMISLDEVETLLSLRNMRGERDFHTLAGFIIDKLGRIPTAGDHFTWENARFEVVDMDGRRVDKVLVYPPADKSSPEYGTIGFLTSMENMPVPENMPAMRENMSVDERIAILEESLARVYEYNQSVTKALTHVLERLKDLEPIAGRATLSAKQFEYFRTAYTLARASKLFPKTRTVVFVSKGYFGDNCKYAFLAFCEYARGKDIAVHFLTDDKKQYDLLQSHGLPCLPYDPDQWTIPDITALLSAKVAVLNDNFHLYSMSSPKAFGMLQGAKSIQLWHGIPIKKVGLLYLLRADNVLLEELVASAGFYDVFVSPDTAFKDEWAQMFAFKELAPLGYPRNDVLFREPTERDRINTDTETLALFENAKRDGKPTILYAPTFRDIAESGWFENAGIAAFNEHARSKGYVFAINLHPFEQANVDAFRKSYPGIHFVEPGKDIYPVLHYADQLITDYSSLAFDYLLVDRPIIFFRPDHEHYMTKQRGFIPGRERFTPGAVVSGVSELARAADSAVNYLRAPATDPFRIARHELRGRLFDHADGNAAQRVCERIEALVNEE